MMRLFHEKEMREAERKEKKRLERYALPCASMMRKLLLANAPHLYTERNDFI
jgi:hypothetical protein